MPIDKLDREQKPQFEGRPLARPDEEVVDQGLAFDLGTLFSRRRMLTMLGLGSAGLTLAACSATASGSSSASSTSNAKGTSTGEIPDETAGPYPGDGSNGPQVLSQSGIVRSDIRSSITDATKAIATSQVALPKDVCTTVYAETGYEQSVKNLSQVTLKTDNVFGDDGGKNQLTTVSGDVSSGYAVSLAVPIDTQTTPSAGQAPGGQPSGGGQPPGGQPSGGKPPSPPK